jgi:hypothetical protein
MKTALIFAFSLCALMLASCAGPVYIAKDETDGIKTSYQDPGLSDLCAKYRPALSQIYRRYQSAGVDIYPNGIGFASISDTQGKQHSYLLVQVRPRNIMFGEVQTKPDERFSEVFRHHLEKNLRYLKAEDVGMEGVDGVAFGVYWPVRDLSQCDKNGGFIEYAIVYLPKNKFIDLAERRTTLSEAIENAEVITSLGRKPAKAVSIKEVQ